MSRAVAGIRPVFFVGGSTPVVDEPDTVALDCPDTDDGLPEKTLAFFKYALKHETFDWLFECDDYTYVALDRLKELTAGGHELTGNADLLHTKRDASGGGGSLLSRRMIELLVADHSLAEVAALRHRASVVPSIRLVWAVAPSPRPDNDVITCHCYDPRKMAVIHAGFTDTVHRQYQVVHKHWKDRLYLYKAGTFRRASADCAGNWLVDASGNLHLKWFDWATEIVQPDRDGYKSEAMRMVLELPPDSPDRKRTLVVQLMGGLGNQMFQYAHGLAIAKHTKADLKLTHSGDGRPFALHHFNLQLSNGIPDAIPVIVDESGYTPGMDVNIRLAVESAMNPTVAVRGYFQNEQFFAAVKDEIRQQFCPPPKLLPEYGNRTPVCVNVRRGDFVDHPLHDVCTLAYYQTARDIISGLVDNPCFVVNSDDIDWCEQSMGSWPDTIFFKPRDVREAFAVMCACRAFIIANSTFGWWAAWLSGSRIVIRPDRFLNNRSWEIGPNHWIRVPGAGINRDRSGPHDIEKSTPQSGMANRRKCDLNPNHQQTPKKPRPRYRVLAYRNGGNLGDTIQTLALAQLLPGPLEGIYRDAAGHLNNGATFVVNGYLCETPPQLSDCLFAGVYIGGRWNEQVEWIRRSSYPVGARDPATVQMLRRAGIESEMIGCATLTLPKYTGTRSGCIRVDDLSPNCKLTQVHNNLPWDSQYESAYDRLHLLRTAELVVTSRLHVVLPCLAFGTPVTIPLEAKKKIFQLDRLSLLDALGFEYGKPNVIDVSEYSRRYIAFLERNLKTNVNRSPNSEAPAPYL